MNSLSLEGKVALITGAGGMSGIGRACALKLASRGANLAISDVKRPAEDLPPQEKKANWRSIDSVAEEIERLGRRCLNIWCDLTDVEQIQQMVNRTAEHYGRLDILVNNARAIIGRDRAPVTELREHVWERFFAINSTAPFLVTKYAARIMIDKANGGRIINMGSDVSKRGRANTAAYSASKFALIGLTQSSALDLAPYNITVNAVCPSSVNTDRMNYWEEEQAKARGISLEQFRAQLSRTLPNQTRLAASPRRTTLRIWSRSSRPRKRHSLRGRPTTSTVACSFTELYHLANGCSISTFSVVFTNMTCAISSPAVSP